MTMSRNGKTNKAAYSQRFTRCSVAVAATRSASVVAAAFDFYICIIISTLLSLIVSLASQLLF
ncbi:unnamed protein product [Arabidopsis thaliana]|uniref:Protein CYSTEINE-RICH TRANSMEMBRANE MODULE 2 n=2 Tax=Arabidopsis thaliana TaxID=3702 RepID=CSTM2_ARATH|nr:cadmium tolerance 1 [Arabidopsis thaliana]Q3ECR7.1 RecName: Full=Protein CYSTEINE-RICH TRANSMEMBRANE MODULE 2; Short=AthCYSTM2; AltName: Full=Protein CADMIUM TOLERANCE 1; Short=AtCDT1; Short=Cd tolerant 1 [Arabidopsis thaliana]ABF74691.1 At1g52827 [Arabidopsis thaliana]AEE32857.2 cadmium tolerance 1 [Arabidopsis thaliana]CAA0290333.1 unnamed protein product [Arabidopsis thaliana]VYS48919.1 unnamed protein product [Arabidopsis thaliana]|eukprot:NP_974010.3 cadmium tolerance 1 [Arabidopsis thaliana]